MFLKIPDQNLWREWWPAWGYVGAELAQSSSNAGVNHDIVAQRDFVELARRRETFVDNCQTLNVTYSAVNYVPFVPGIQKRKA